MVGGRAVCGRVPDAPLPPLVSLMTPEEYGLVTYHMAPACRAAHPTATPYATVTRIYCGCWNLPADVPDAVPA